MFYMNQKNLVLGGKSCVQNRKSGFSEGNREFEPDNPALPGFFEHSEHGSVHGVAPN